jgi:hypothetical protein
MKAIVRDWVERPVAKGTLGVWVPYEMVISL